MQGQRVHDDKPSTEFVVAPVQSHAGTMLRNSPWVYHRHSLGHTKAGETLTAQDGRAVIVEHHKSNWRKIVSNDVADVLVALDYRGTGTPVFLR